MFKTDPHLMCVSIALSMIRKSEAGDAWSGRDREDTAGRYRDGRSIRGISWDLSMSRATVRKVLFSEATGFVCERRTQPRPKIGPWQSKLEGILEENAFLPKRDQKKLMRIFEDLRDSTEGVEPETKF